MLAGQPIQIRPKQTNTRCTWAGGTFFPVVLLCQFFFWWEIGFGFTYQRTLLNKLFYELIFFLIVVEVLAVFFGGLLHRSNYDQKKKPVSTKSELPPKTICRKIMWSQFPPNLSWFLVLLLCISFSFLKNIEPFLCK